MCDLIGVGGWREGKRKQKPELANRSASSLASQLTPLHVVLVVVMKVETEDVGVGELGAADRFVSIPCSSSTCSFVYRLPVLKQARGSALLPQALQTVI